MDRFSTTDDVYRHLVEESDDAWILGLLAFAIVEQQRVDWAKHRNKATGVAPSPEEIRKWYEDQPPSILLRARAEAQTALENYGAEAVELFDDSYRSEIAQGIVVGEIQKLGRWGPQLGMNVVGGVIGSLVFTAALILLGFFVLNEPSVNDVTLKLQQQLENTHGPVRDHK
jgi:hypothetical protein